MRRVSKRAADFGRKIFVSVEGEGPGKRTKIEVMEGTTTRIFRTDYVRTEYDKDRYIKTFVAKYRIPKENIFEMSSEEYLALPEVRETLEDPPELSTVTRMTTTDKHVPIQVARVMTSDSKGN